MADVGTFLQQIITDPVGGTTASAATVAVTLGGYWLFRHDDNKPTSSITKLLFAVAAVIAVVGTGYLISHHLPKSAPASNLNTTGSTTSGAAVEPVAKPQHVPANPGPAEQTKNKKRVSDPKGGQGSNVIEDPTQNSVEVVKRNEPQPLPANPQKCTPMMTSYVNAFGQTENKLIPCRSN